MNISAFRYLDVFLRRVMTDSIVFSPRRRAFVNKPGQAFRAEEYTDVKGEQVSFTSVISRCLVRINAACSEFCALGP